MPSFPRMRSMALLLSGLIALLATPSAFAAVTNSGSILGAHENLSAVRDAAPRTRPATTFQANPASGSVRECPASVPGGLDCTLYTSMVSAAAAAAVSATDKAKTTLPESLTVTGRGSARAPVTRATFTVSVEVSSADVHSGALQDISRIHSGPFGEVERWSPAAVEQAMNPARKNEVLFCASCVNREAGRRVTSILNFLHLRNQTYVKDNAAEIAAAAAAAGGDAALAGPVGVAPPKTTRMSLNPDYEYKDSKRVLVGYTGRSSVTVDVPVALAGDIMDGVLAAGATSMSDITLAATPAALIRAQLEADANAADAATARAQNVLSALKVEGSFPLVRVTVMGSGASSAGGAEKYSRMADAAPMLMSAAAGFGGGSGNAGAVVGDDVVVESTVEIAVSFGAEGGASSRV